jgi:hypothetical protein
MVLVELVVVMVRSKAAVGGAERPSLALREGGVVALNVIGEGSV